MCSLMYPRVYLYFAYSQYKPNAPVPHSHYGSVYAWGLNDKEQLGGPRGSKVKFPAFNPIISALRPIQIVGGSKCLFIVTEVCFLSSIANIQ